MAHLLFDRVSDLAALTPEQILLLRALAAKDPRDVEEQLQMLLRRWSEPMLRRYVADVLVDAADHAAWIREHHVFPTPEQELVALLRRPLTPVERDPVASISELRAEHQTLGAHIRARHGRLAAKAYLELVVRESTATILTDYVDSVLDGTLSHATWVERSLARLAPLARRSGE